MDRDWHTPVMWCSTCDEELKEKSDNGSDGSDHHQPWEAQGRSMSNADGSASEEGENSDDDHLAHACPAVH